MNGEQTVYLRNNHPVPQKGEPEGAGTLSWQYDSKLYSLAPGKTIPLPYYLANHAVSAGPLHREHLEIIDEKHGAEAARQSMADVAELDAKRAREEAQRVIEVAKEKEAEAKRLRAQANANKPEEKSSK